MDNVAISVQNVSMMFNLSKEKIMSLKEYVVRALKRQLFYEEFWALKDVSFTVEKGEILGVMGLNGAGKSTLLKIIAGVFKPTVGSVFVNGELSPLLELGAGFEQEFSARDNVYMNGAMYGYTPAFMDTKYDEIMDFAELWEFEDVAIKNFSTGMRGRLGFAVATSVQPDILIVDEILGVGDFKFQKKCEERINKMISGGVTVLLVTHNVTKIKEMCSRAMLLEKGKLVCIGDVDEVCEIYGDK
ncbi:MAG: ABC transporter ATP-binding protein [Oscillospiraceae bacterium]|nr:ABC transporter ATP-binding protein [Oscillospiraceae bacterium]